MSEPVGEDAGGARGGDIPPAEISAIAAEPWLVPLGVAISALGAGALGWILEPERLMLVLVPLVPVGYVLAVIDARTRLLPRAVVIPATLAVVAALVLEWALTGDLDVLARSGVGLVIARTAFWLLWLLTRDARTRRLPAGRRTPRRRQPDHQVGRRGRSRREAGPPPSSR